MYPFLHYRSHSKAKATNQAILFCFRKRLNIDQSNIQTAMAENEEQYTLSNIIYIEFLTFYFFLCTLKPGLFGSRQITWNIATKFRAGYWVIRKPLTGKLGYQKTLSVLSGSSIVVLNWQKINAIPEAVYFLFSWYILRTLSNL